ncbi:MAG: hypothetical protein ACRBCL_06390 [Maritimibacter sp.]
MRGLVAYILSLVLTLSGFALAEARGTHHDLRDQIVICTGVGLKTISIGPDGTPMQTIELCPDGYSILSDGQGVVRLEAPALRLLGGVTGQQVAALLSRNELVPSARGPPLVS